MSMTLTPRSRRGCAARVRRLRYGISIWTLCGMLLGLAFCPMFMVEQAAALTFAQDDLLDGPLEVVIPPCERKVRLIGEITRQGLELLGTSNTIDGSRLKIVVTVPVLTGDPLASRCSTSYFALTSNFSWELTARPAGSSAALEQTDTLTPRLRPDRSGDYTVQFTACANGACELVLSPSQIFILPAVSQTFSFTAKLTLALPPQTEPFVPVLPETDETRFEDIDKRCGPKPEILSTPWRMAREWRGPNDYDFLEGRVTEAHVAGRDNKFNHDSQDWNTFVDPDPPYRYLLPALPLKQNLMEVEWERRYFPTRFRPTRGDRTSVLGYWIHDCDHGAKTEIHPPVMAVTHRARPIRLPEAEGYGENVYIAGIVSDIWINRNGGEATKHCDGFGLHQLKTVPPRVSPTGTPITCIPQSEDFDSNPINRRFSFRVYLPGNPMTVMAEIGRTAPDLDVYLRIRDPESDGGPNPVIIVRRQSDGNAHLDVSINLSRFAGSRYSRQIEAGWVYPAPDNWGLTRWKVRLLSMDVHNDMDGRLRGDGDWRFWVNTNNRFSEWNMIFDCDGCVHGLEDFRGRPWETGTDDARRSLGPDLLLFPNQAIFFHTSGYEEDGVRTQAVGHVTRIHPQQASVYFAKANTHAYTLNYEIVEAGPVGNASLSSAGQAIFDAYTLTSSRPGTTFPSVVVARRDWRVPEDLRLEPGDKPVALADLKLFHTQSLEPSSLHDISSEDFVKQIAAARETQPKDIETMMGKLQEEMLFSAKYRDPVDARADLAVLKQVVPADLYKSHLAEIEAILQPKGEHRVPWWWVVLGVLITALILILVFVFGLPAYRRRRA